MSVTIIFVIAVNSAAPVDITAINSIVKNKIEPRFPSTCDAITGAIESGESTAIPSPAALHLGKWQRQTESKTRQFRRKYTLLKQRCFYLQWHAASKLDLQRPYRSSR